MVKAGTDVGCVPLLNNRRWRDILSCVNRAIGSATPKTPLEWVLADAVSLALRSMSMSVFVVASLITPAILTSLFGICLFSNMCSKKSSFTTIKHIPSNMIHDEVAQNRMNKGEQNLPCTKNIYTSFPFEVNSLRYHSAVSQNPECQGGGHSQDLVERFPGVGAKKITS